MTNAETVEEAMDAMPESQREMFEIMQKREPLIDELKMWVEDDAPGFGPMLKHPLCYMMLGNPKDGIYPFGAQANEVWRRKKESLNKAIEERSWFAVVFVMYERPYRLTAFRRIEQELDNHEWWSILGSIWTDSENIWQNSEEWHTYLSDDRPGREAMMEDEERERLGKLGEEVTIYRGYRHPDRRDAASWTLDRIKAEWFAKRLAQANDPPPMVATAKVKHEHILAFFNGRQEHEIVVLPQNLNVIEEEQLDED